MIKPKKLNPGNNCLEWAGEGGIEGRADAALSSPRAHEFPSGGERVARSEAGRHGWTRSGFHERSQTGKVV